MGDVFRPDWVARRPLASHRPPPHETHGDESRVRLVPQRHAVDRSVFDLAPRVRRDGRAGRVPRSSWYLRGHQRHVVRNCGAVQLWRRKRRVSNRDDRGWRNHHRVVDLARANTTELGSLDARHRTGRGAVSGLHLLCHQRVLRQRLRVFAPGRDLHRAHRAKWRRRRRQRLRAEYRRRVNHNGFPVRVRRFRRHKRLRRRGGADVARKHLPMRRVLVLVRQRGYAWEFVHLGGRGYFPNHIRLGNRVFPIPNQPHEPPRRVRVRETAGERLQGVRRRYRGELLVENNRRAAQPREPPRGC